MAAASSTRRRTVKRKGGVDRRVLIVGGALLLLVLVLWLRHRSASSGSLNTSGTPGPDMTGSAASLAPSGGAAGVANNTGSLLPINEPNNINQQVQQTDASHPDAPTASSLPGQGGRVTYPYPAPYQQPPGTGYGIGVPVPPPGPTPAPVPQPAPIPNPGGIGRVTL